MGLHIHGNRKKEIATCPACHPVSLGASNEPLTTKVVYCSRHILKTPFLILCQHPFVLSLNCHRNLLCYSQDTYLNHYFSKCDPGTTCTKITSPNLYSPISKLGRMPKSLDCDKDLYIVHKTAQPQVCHQEELNKCLCYY